MFLNQLNNEEKEAFISLCVHAANSNGSFEVEEKQMISEYCKEMGIGFFDAGNVVSMESIVKIFKDDDISTKRIVVLELLGLMYSDGAYDDLEKKFVADFVEQINLSKVDMDTQENLLNKYLELVSEMVNSINI